jgi:hypothetical protein
MDTACPIRLLASFTCDGGAEDGSEQVRFEVRYDVVTDGTAVYRSAGDAPAATATEQSAVFTLAIDSGASQGNDVQISGYVDLTVPTAIANRSSGVGDLLWISIERDATHVDDTYAGDVNLIQMSPYYTQWCNGGHLAGQ